MRFYKKRNLFAFIGLGIILILSSCAKEVENRGYVTRFSDFSKLEVGKSTKFDVSKELGSPTTTSKIDNEKWMYLGVEETKESFFDPEVESYEAYILTFSKSGILSDISKRDKSHLNEFAVSEDFTDTGGNEVTFMQQLLGNLGKFNPATSRRR